MAKKKKVIKKMEKASKRISSSPARGAGSAGKRTSKAAGRGGAKSKMVRGMEQASKKTAKRGSMKPPKKGDQLECEVCGMGIKVTADCHSNDVSLTCCGQELTRV